MSIHRRTEIAAQRAGAPPAPAERPPVHGAWRPALPDVGPALEWSEVALGRGDEHPDLLPEGDSHLHIRRTFCFADLTGFTAFTRNEGPDAAVELLGEFRRVTRTVAAKRGVRVAKWLGDGVMLVGVQPKPTIALGAHLITAFADANIGVRVGVASGTALLFEGDDYIGEPVNLAAKLCSAARRGEMLAVAELEDLPEWVAAGDHVTVDIRGVGRIAGVRRLEPRLDAPGRVA